MGVIRTLREMFSTFVCMEKKLILNGMIMSQECNVGELKEIIASSM